MSDLAELRIGIIGLGIGQFHASCFSALPGVRIVAVADRGGRRLPGPLAEFAAHYGARPYSLGEEMIAEETLDAVSICSPPASHRALVERAAARGMHVLLEKPMAWNLEDCDAMIAACATAKVGLHLNFPMRRLAVVKTLRRLLGAGELGKPALASADYVMGPRPPGHWVWTHPAGPIGENACHFIDLLRYLLGQADQVSAVAANALGPGAPAVDCAALMLRFQSGAVANLVGGAIATTELGVSPRLSLYGTAGQAAADGLHHTLTHLRWATRGGAVQTFEFRPCAGAAFGARSVRPVPPAGGGVDRVRRVASQRRRAVCHRRGGAGGRGNLRCGAPLRRRGGSTSTIEVQRRPYISSFGGIIGRNAVSVLDGFDHVGVTVRDLDRSLAFYRDLLGLEVLRRRDRFKAQHVQRLVGLPGAELSVAMLAVPGGAKIELVQYHEPEGADIIAAPCDRGGVHFALLVNDIHALKAALEAKGVAFVSEPQCAPSGPVQGTYFVYCRDPDGAIVELIQPAAKTISPA